MEEYEQFAYIYDELMDDIDYEGIVDFIEEIFKINNIKPELVLDLACGTGTITNCLAKRGYDMIGVDISEDMLEVATAKSQEANLEKVLYLCQDMREFELYGTVDAITCMFDSLNYITSFQDIKKIFSLANNYLNPNGLFIFDMNTIHKLSSVLGDNTFSYSTDNVTYIWENEYDIRKRICDFYLTFFVKSHGIEECQDSEGQNQEQSEDQCQSQNEDQCQSQDQSQCQGETLEDENCFYTKFTEHHREKGYAIEAIEEALTLAGFKLVAKYDEYSFKEGNRKSERITFVAINITPKVQA